GSDWQVERYARDPEPQCKTEQENQQNSIAFEDSRKHIQRQEKSSAGDQNQKQPEDERSRERPPTVPGENRARGGAQPRRDLHKRQRRIRDQQNQQRQAETRQIVGHDENQERIQNIQPDQQFRLVI